MRWSWDLETRGLLSLMATDHRPHGEAPRADDLDEPQAPAGRATRARVMFIVNLYVASSVRTNTASSGIVTNLPGEQADEDLAGMLGGDPGSLEHIGSVSRFSRFVVVRLQRGFLARSVRRT